MFYDVVDVMMITILNEHPFLPGKYGIKKAQQNLYGFFARYGLAMPDGTETVYVYYNAMTTSTRADSSSLSLLKAGHERCNELPTSCIQCLDGQCVILLVQQL